MDVKKSIENTLPYLRRYAHALVSDAQLADDMVFECIACLTDMTYLWEQQEDGAAKAWVFGVFHNLHNDLINSKQQRRSFSQHTDAAQLNLNQLTPLQAQVFLLVALEGFGYKDVATILNISLGELLNHIHGARVSLRAQMKKNQLVPATSEAV
ncbi:MAG: RNA polymerase sigma factor [Gammaproteobacteria bacterium]|nr:RNA polymerase sigma factor [Gammaproteobacteria bacterium]MDH5800996.1 RNA polymerase sigma factor [Gammaproteobacteria bacterium]